MNQKDVIFALIDSYFDKFEEINKISYNSIFTISNRQRNLVLSCCLDKFNDPKFNIDQTNNLIKSLELLKKIISDLNENLDDLIKEKLILFTILIFKRRNDTAFIKNNKLEIQFEKLISNILTAIGKKYCKDVFNKIFEEFNLDKSLNVDEEYLFAIKTIGDLCIENPLEIFEFLDMFLDKFTPLIINLRLENQKFVFAYTISCIALAIQENFAEEKTQKLNNSNNIKIKFEKNFDSLFEVFFTWINTKELDTKEQTIKAIGLISSLMSEKKFSNVNLKIIEILITSYKRQNLSLPYLHKGLTMFYVSQSLSQVLNVSLNNKCGLMIQDLDANSKSQFETLLSVLFQQLSLPINSRFPNSINNYNEILRAFSILSVVHCSVVVNFILQKFNSTTVPVKIAGLAVIKHLIDTRTNEIKEKFSSIFFVLRSLVDEDNNRLKKILIQVIVSIAYKGYLNMEGGKSLVQFIIKQCSLKVSPNETELEQKKITDLTTFNSVSFDTNEVSNYTLKQMAENVLSLFVNTVEDIDKVLWPQIFEYIILDEYINATGTLCRALYVIGDKLIKKQDEQFNINFNKSLPKKEQLLVRLTILIADDPNKNLENIKIYLNLMSIIHKLINPKLELLWNTVCKQYLKILLNDEQLDKYDWQNKCLALVNQSLIEISENDFSIIFGKHLLTQLHFYNDNLFLKYFAIQVLASVTCRINQKNYSEDIMNSVMSKVDLNNEIERKACAILFGQCAANHLDLVLVKLEKFLICKKSFISSILSTLRSNDQNDLDKIKATIIISYGYVTKFANSSLLVTRIETPMLNSINSLYLSSKDNILVRNAFVSCVKIIATSLTSKNLDMVYIFKGRTQLIYEMVNIIKLQEVSINVIMNSIEAISSLVLLNPLLTATEKSTLIEVVAKVVYSFDDFNLLNKFKLLLKNILHKEDKNSDNLNIMLEILMPYLQILKNESIKISAIGIIKFILDEFESSLKSGDFLKSINFSYLCALILPHCFDELSQIRNISLDCLAKLVLISVKIHSKEILNNDLITSFNESIENCKLEDIDTETIANELSKCIIKKLRSDNIQTQKLSLTIKLISSLNDFLGFKKSHGTALIAYELTKSFVSEFVDEIYQLIEIVYQVRLDYTKINSILVKLLYEIAYNFLNIFCNHLLTYQLSFGSSMVEFWQLFSELKEFNTLLIVWLMENLNEDNLLIYDKQKSSAIVKKEQLAMVYALGELFKQNKSYEVVCKNSDKLFSCLLVVLANYVGVEQIQNNWSLNTSSSIYNNNYSESSTSIASSMTTIQESKSVDIKKIKPISCAIFTMKQYLNLLKHQKLLLMLENKGCWKLMEESNQFHVSFDLIVKGVYLYQPSLIPAIVQPLLKLLKKNSVESKIVPVVFFSYLLSIKFYPDKELLNEIFLNTILNMVNDNSLLIRLLSIRALGTIDDLQNSNQKYVLPVISALINSLDDSNVQIKFEALKNLCLVISKINLNLIEDLIINLTLRLKSLFCNEEYYIREKSIEAVGLLMEDNNSNHLLKEEAINLLIPLLVSLNDTVSDVTKITKFSLNKLVTVIDIKSIETIVKKNLSEQINLHYVSFISAFTKLLMIELSIHVNDFISLLLIYLKSKNVRTQCNSIQILGCFMNNDLDKNVINNDLKEKSILLIVQFLKHPNNLEIRMKAAETLSTF